MRLRMKQVISSAARLLPHHLSREELERHCAWVLRLSPDDRRRQLSGGDRAGHPDVARRLVAQSYSLRFSNQGEALRLANAAVDVAECLHLPLDARPLLMDVQAEAFGNLANCQRLCRHFDEAEESWRHTERCLAQGTDDVLLAANLSRMRGAFLSDRRWFDQAIPLLQQAADIGSAAGDRHLSAKIRIELGIALNRAGKSTEALAINENAVGDLDPLREPEAAFSLLHNSLVYLEATGQTESALRGLQAAERVYVEAATPRVWLRYLWMRGRLHNAHGEWAAAVAHLDAVRTGFLRANLAYDACFVSLELALAYAQLPDLLKVYRLGREMYPVFLSFEMPRETSAVLLAFGQAAHASERITAAQLAQWAAKLSPIRLAYERGEPWAQPATVAQDETSTSIAVPPEAGER